MLLLDAKYTKELADAKVENDVCVMMLLLVVVVVVHQSSLSGQWSHYRLRRG